MSLDSYTDKDLQDELKRRDDSRKVLAAMSKDHRLAVFLHDAYCTWNHTDGCEWFYEVKGDVHDWAGLSHQQWLKRARSALKVLDDPDLIMKVAKAVR